MNAPAADLECFAHARRGGGIAPFRLLYTGETPAIVLFKLFLRALTIFGLLLWSYSLHFVLTYRGERPRFLFKHLLLNTAGKRLRVFYTNFLLVGLLCRIIPSILFLTYRGKRPRTFYCPKSQIDPKIDPNMSPD